MASRRRAARAARKGGPAPSRSGTQWSDRDYARAGYGRITLRLPLDALEMLQAIADDMGESRAVAIDTLIRMEHEHSAITGGQREQAQQRDE